MSLPQASLGVGTRDRELESAESSLFLGRYLILKAFKQILINSEKKPRKVRGG